MNMEELAKLCESADGHDREIDALIHVALYPAYYRLATREDIDNEQEAASPGDVVCLKGFVGAVVASPRYTATIDEAAKARPKDYAYTVSWIGIASCQADARVWLPSQKGDGISAQCDNAATPSLALCAASLRARAASTVPLP